jgi:glutathione S-transferase
LFKKPTNEAVLAENVEKLNNTLAVYESILSKQKYLVGDQLTLVDLYHVPLMQLAEMNGFFSLEDKPNVAR